MRIVALIVLAVSVGGSAFAQELGFMDREALSLGRAVMGLAFFAAWFWATTKAAESGHKWLAWGVGLAPIWLFIMGAMGVFR